MSQDAAPILATVNSAIGIIELARPQIFNCLSQHCLSLILQALRRFEADGSIRAVLIKAQGKNFCTGAELGEVKSLLADQAGLTIFINHGHTVLSALEESRLPVVVAVQGLCLAGGLELTMSADIVFAAKTARFGDQHGQFGLVPGWGGTQRLPRIVGLRRAMDLFMSVRWIEATTALDWGLVNYVVEDETLHTEALAFCTKVAGRSAPGMALIKRLARTGLDGALAAGLRQEVREVVKALGTADVAEGLAAFEARRQPVFPSAQNG